MKWWYNFRRFNPCSTIFNNATGKWMKMDARMFSRPTVASRSPMPKKADTKHHMLGPEPNLNVISMTWDEELQDPEWHALLKCDYNTSQEPAQSVVGWVSLGIGHPDIIASHILSIAPYKVGMQVQDPSCAIQGIVRASFLPYSRCWISTLQWQMSISGNWGTHNRGWTNLGSPTTIRKRHHWTPPPLNQLRNSSSSHGRRLPPIRWSTSVALCFPSWGIACNLR